MEGFEAEEDLPKGMVLATSLCKAQGGDRAHDWREIEGKTKHHLFSFITLQLAFVFFLSIIILYNLHFFELVSPNQLFPRVRQPDTF